MNRTASRPLLWAVVPAGGSGQRLGGVVAKQFLKVHGQSVLQHTLNALLAHRQIVGAVVALPSNEMDTELRADKPLVCVAGGTHRADSVRACLRAIPPSDTEQLVAVHDAARPCFRTEHLDALFATAADHPVGAIWAQPCSDTLKRCDADLQITETIDRSTLWRAQTPQIFRLEALQLALESAHTEGFVCTDESQAMERQGLFARIVQCPDANPKLTVASDLPALELFLSQSTMR